MLLQKKEYVRSKRRKQYECHIWTFQKTAAFLEKMWKLWMALYFLGETREPRKLADAADLSIDEWKELNVICMQISFRKIMKQLRKSGLCL